MASFLSKLFKPKWQHASAEVRKAEIQNLDQSDADNQTIFLELMLNDPDNQVRITAIQKISDPATLLKHYTALPSEIQSDTLTRITTLCDQLGLSLFDMVEDSKLLADIIAKSDQPDAFMNSLALIQNEAALLHIASNAQLSRLRQAAAELIESEETLQELGEYAKSKDKSVFQITKSKLSAIKTRQKSSEEQAAQVSALLAGLSDLAVTEDTKLYAAKLDSFKQRWNGLEHNIDPQKTDEFEMLVQKCQARASDLAQATQNKSNVSSDPDQPRPSSDSDEVGNERDATIKTLGDTIDQLKKQAANSQDIAAIDAIIKTQETRWIECAKEVTIDKADQKRFTDLMGELRRFLSALQRCTQQSNLLEALLKEDSSDGDKKLREVWEKIAWPKDFEKPPILARCAERISLSNESREANAERQAELCQEFETTLKKVDQALEEKLLKDSKSQMQALRKVYGQLEKKTQNRYSAALKLRSNQLEELRDWQGFAASPQQERLCEAMESLAEQHLAPQQKADRIKQLQEEWKALGGAREQSLWERFSAAADKAFEPCAEFFGEQGELKKANHRKRTKLLEELSSFLEQNNWESADWKAVEKINRQARNEWREAYPVDHRKSRPLQEQFNAVLSTLDEKLNGERAKNLALKQDIVSRAEALVTAENLNEAMQGAKNLQTEWQKVGITEHKKDRALWKAFRKACDAIFEQRDAERNKAKQEVDEKVSQAQQRLATAKETYLQEFEDLESVNKALTELRKEIKLIGDIPAKLKNKLYDEYNALAEHLKSNQKALSYQETESKWLEADRKARILAKAAVEPHNQDKLEEEFKSTRPLGKKLEDQFVASWRALQSGNAKADTGDMAQELCIRCEIAAGVDSPQADKERRMQLQVSRLSEGMSGNANLSREEQLNELLNQWYAVHVISEAQRDGLAQRIAQCIRKVYGVPEDKASPKKEPA